MGESFIVRKRGAAEGNLYVFSSHTFTNATATGTTGPTLAQCRTAYSAASWTQNNSFFNMTTQGIQEWTVPANGNYRIEAYGAEGGSDSSQGPGGRGARMRGDFQLSSGTGLKIVVGQQGINHSGDGGGGGGGRFVYTGDIGGNGLLSAAGGGGGAGEENTANGRDANSSTSPNNTTGGFTIGQGGTGGNRSSAGAGWLSDGSGSPTGYDGTRWNGGTSSSATSSGAGGFGGGGAHNPSDGGGGGGGYTGGNGTNSTTRTDWAGSGAGSFNSGANQSNSAGAGSGQGQVIVTKL